LASDIATLEVKMGSRDGQSAHDWTRRRFGLAGGGFLATVFGLDPLNDAAARKKRRKRKRCKNGTKKCDRRCIPQTQCCGGCGEDQRCCAGTCAGCCANEDCPVDAPCVDGVCDCPTAGDVACGNICTDLATDPGNCGACENACNTGNCDRGACECEGVGDCPEACFCAARLQGTPVCIDFVTNEPCDEDNDCPLGSACLVSNRCSAPCFG
jgi:hypothetical protein